MDIDIYILSLAMYRPKLESKITKGNYTRKGGLEEKPYYEA